MHLSKALTLFLIAGVSSGCATPTPNPWNEIDVTVTPAATPIECGSFPYPTEVIGESVVYDNAALNDLEAYRVCSEANKQIAQEHAQQIRYLKESRMHLVEAGKSQRMIADMRQQMLEEERKARFWNNLTLYAVIAAMGFSL